MGRPEKNYPPKSGLFEVVGVGVKEPAVLVLEDGASFPGEAWAARGKAGGPVVFTTAMTGYQEALTDPAAYEAHRRDELSHDWQLRRQ